MSGRRCHVSEHTSTSSIIPGAKHQDCRDRLREEFADMPGLRLTVRQAARLLAVDGPACERLIGELVSGGELAQDGDCFAVPRFARR
jgi:hypothetical protein